MRSLRCSFSPRGLLPALFAILLVSAGCSLGDASAEEGQAPEAPAFEARDPIPLDYAELIPIRVYSSPTCGCCSLWVEHLEANGFEPEVVHRNDLAEVKRNFGVTDNLVSCHTAVVHGYVVEGHVPAADIRRLLAEVPEGVRGVAVPGMPIGSPGMEMGDRVDPYDVLLFREGGRTEVYARYGR